MMRPDDAALISFAEDLAQEILTEAEVEGVEAMRAEVFTRRMIETLVESGELEEALSAYHRDRGVEVSGYGVDDEDTLNLISSDYRGEIPPGSVTRTDVSTAFRRLEGFWERCRDRPYHEDLEESSDAHDMARHIHRVAPRVRRIRMFLVTDGLSAVEYMEPEERDGVEVRRSIWDLARLQRLEASRHGREPVEVDLISRHGRALPCLTAGTTGADYSAYLAVLPGALLADIYEEHGARLLELNVRSFLQASNKVNRGIRDSLAHEPERFLAYNNGISATASEIDLVDLPEGGRGIARIRDLQIVNGGQTTASVHRARGRVDLSRVGVQAKITVIDPERLDEVVPLISRYANSQNKVQEADLSANHPFHVELESLSRTVWAPATGETLRQTRWFYERARGSYRDAQNRELTSARRRAFKQVHPPSQRFTKTDVAKFENTWDQLPHEVSRGAQKNFTVFMGRLRSRRTGSPDVTYFQRLVAKAILFRRAERIVTEQQFGGYRANIVTYALAKLSHATAQRVDLVAIWDSQGLAEPLEVALAELSHLAYHVVVERTPGGANVTEWSKREQCWTLLKETGWTPPQGLAVALVAREPTRGQPATISDSGDVLIREVSDVGGDHWLAIANWARETDNLSPWQRRFAYTVGVQLRRGRDLTPKQAVQAERILETAAGLGFQPEARGDGDGGSWSPRHHKEDTPTVDAHPPEVSDTADGYGTPGFEPPGAQGEHSFEAASSGSGNGDACSTPVEAVLSVRAINCLRSIGVHTLQDLTNNTASEIRAIRNLGESSMQEIEDVLAQHGLALRTLGPSTSGGAERGSSPRRRPGNASRDSEIVELREQGLSLRDIAARVGLSAEGVRRALTAAGRDLDPSYVTELRRGRRIDNARSHLDAILDAYRASEPVGEVAARLELKRSTVEQLIAESATESDKAERARNHSRGIPEAKYSDEDLLAAIRTIADLVGRTPTSGDYLRKAPALGLPSIATITNRLGTWTAAAESAGMTPGGARRSYTRMWDAGACRTALEMVIEELGRIPTAAHYEALALSREDLPSIATVRNRLGRWKRVTVELAREREERPG